MFYDITFRSVLTKDCCPDTVCLSLRVDILLNIIFSTPNLAGRP